MVDPPRIGVFPRVVDWSESKSDSDVVEYTLLQHLDVLSLVRDSEGEGGLDLGQLGDTRLVFPVSLVGDLAGHLGGEVGLHHPESGRSGVIVVLQGKQKSFHREHDVRWSPSATTVGSFVHHQDFIHVSVSLELPDQEIVVICDLPCSLYEFA